MPICYLPGVSIWTSDEFYNKLHTGNPGDREFYERVCREAARVVELGCGWGRITEGLAASGAHVLGIEANPSRVEQARNRLERLPQVTISNGDIRDQSQDWAERPGEPFDRVVVPYNTVYALGGKPGVAACFTVARKLLRPGGELWFDVYPMDALHEAALAGEELPEDDDEPVAILDAETEKLRVLERSTFSLELQRLDVTYVAVNDEGREVANSSLRHDSLLGPELVAMLGASGFEVSLMLGGFDGRPYDEEAEQLIIGATAT
jgi:SAM-dependent methyltransferase